MTAKKLKLKSSVNTINTKAAVGKKKALPKLKVILANPYKPEKKTLNENELSDLKEIISSEIKSLAVSGKQYLKKSNIHLGLGSSLRAISMKKSSCVLISQTIKPKCIIDQIEYFTKQTNSTAPVYIVNDFVRISQELFGIKAIVAVFPSNLPGKLGTWISKRTLPPKVIEMATKNEQREPIFKPKDDIKIDLSSIYLKKTSNSSTRAFVPDIVVKTEELPVPEPKNWTGDYISFSDPVENIEQMDIDEIDEEFEKKQDKALDVLQNMYKDKEECKSKSKKKFKLKQETPNQPICTKKQNILKEEWENDVFSKTYIGLEVHKIQPNPNGKPKNKRKNKKNKKSKQSELTGNK